MHLTYDIFKTDFPDRKSFARSARKRNTIFVVIIQAKNTYDEGIERWYHVPSNISFYRNPCLWLFGCVDLDLDEFCIKSPGRSLSKMHEKRAMIG